MKTLSIILSFCISSMSIAQEDIFANEGSGTFQNNPASYGNQEIWSVTTFGQISFSEYDGSISSLNVNAGGLIPLTRNTKHQLIVGGSYSYGQAYFINNLITRLSMGYRLKWNENTSASVAFGPGMSDRQYNPFHPTLSVNGDELYFTEENHGRQFDMSIGAMFNWKTLYTGFSVTHMNRPSVGIFPIELAPTYNLQAGYKIPIKEHFIFPVLQLQFLDGFSSYQFMTNYLFKKELFSLGMGYRSGGGVILGTSLEFKGMRLGYNYNTYIKRLEGQSTGTHELRLSYIVKEKKKS